MPGPFDKEELLTAKAGFVRRRSVRFQDVDAAGIVFYPRILEYFHDAYVELLDARGCSLSAALSAKAWAAPIKHAQADFLRPIRFGELIRVAVVKARLEGSVLTVGFRAEAGEDGPPVAVGRSVHVFVDPSSFERVPPPEVVAGVFRELTGA
ncbi:MAG: acyl-CoA thioesterase [Myxococcaceae bacterium]